MFWLAAIEWWMLGTSSMLWLRRGDNITWGELAVCLLMGFIGPALWIIISIVILVRADFWDRPVLSKRKSE